MKTLHSPNMAPPVVKLDAEPGASKFSKVIYFFIVGIRRYWWLPLIFCNYNAFLNTEASFQIQRDPVFERKDSLTIFAAMNIVYIVAAMYSFCRWHPPLLPPKDHLEKEKANYSSALAAQLRPLLKGRKYDIRMEFAEYLANPTRFTPSLDFPAYSRFSRRQQAYGIFEAVVLNMAAARFPFREWSKINNRIPASWDLPCQVVAWGILFGWEVIMLREAMWLGLSVKLGPFAREIRRAVLRVDHAELGIEQACVEKEAKERLQWLIVELLSDAEDAEALAG